MNTTAVGYSVGQKLWLKLGYWVESFHCKLNLLSSPHLNVLTFLFDLILNIPSTIFQLNRDRSSWVEPVLS